MVVTKMFKMIEEFFAEFSKKIQILMIVTGLWGIAFAITSDRIVAVIAFIHLVITVVAAVGVKE